MKTKHYLLGALAAMMLMTSCQDDTALMGNEGETAMVSFELTTPEIATRAYSDGNTATVLQYAVYDENGGILPDLTVTDGEIHGSTTVNLQLTTGNTYTVIFWAAAPDAPYTVDFANKTMTVDYTNAVSNDENRDAFYKIQEITVRGTQSETVELRRPFAQLNIGTNDYTASTSAGYTPKYSSVTVKGLGSTLNLWDGTVDAARNEITFDFNEIPTGETFPVAGYEYLAMNYLLVPAEQEVVDIEFSYGETATAEKTRTVGSVPVQRNHRTNIYGQLLTSDVDINVVIVPAYDESDLEADPLQLAAAVGGKVTLTKDVVLTKPLNVTANMELDLNGHTISAELAKENNNSIINNNAILKIVGNGTITNTTENGSAVIRNGGTLILDGVEILGAPIASGSYPDYAVYTSGNLVVEDGTIISSDRGAINIQNGANVTINGGNINVTNALNGRVLTAHVIYASGSTSKLTINNGEFALNYEAAGSTGASVICPAGATIDVYNGKFTYAGDLYQSGIFQNYMGYGAPVNVYGGTYNDNTVAKNVADGYKAVQNGSIWYVVADEINAIVANADELAAAVAAGNDNIYLLDGEYDVKNCGGKTLTLNGSRNAVLKVVGGAQSEAGGQLDYGFDGSTVTFNGVTIQTNGQTYAGYTRLKGNYIDVNFENCYCLNGASTFENCTFTQMGDQYNLWTWGAPTAYFNNCTFNSDGKAVLLYGTENTKLTIENSTFNDNGGLPDLKAAIEIGNDYNKSYNLVVNNATVNGFEINDKGINTGTTLWANKNSMGQDKLNVVVDGVDVY